jgi:hypothetical protein
MFRSVMLLETGRGPEVSPLQLPTNDTTPTWSWSPGGGGNGTYRYKLDSSDLSSGATQTTSTSYTPVVALSEGSHTLYVQERDTVGNWSGSGSFTITIDITEPSAPSITTDGGNGLGNDYSTTDSSITLEGSCAGDTLAIYVNGSMNGVTYIAGETSWTYTDTLEPGANTFDIIAEDAAGNLSEIGSIAVGYDVPIGGYVNDNVIPSAQINQSVNGDGIITIRFKIKDASGNDCTLHTFQYSVNGGGSWNVPANADDSESLSSNWKENGGYNYSSTQDFESAEEHSFTFNTKHQDVTGLDGEDQGDVRVRFSLNDGTYDSLFPITSENIRVDNFSPTIQSYPIIDYSNNTVVVTYSESNMQNATDEANYGFSPSLNFATPGDDITNPNGSTYRLDLVSIPPYSILTLTVNNIKDQAGNPVSPPSIKINDDNSDEMADDWEDYYSVENPNDDPDSDGLTNVQESNSGTDPQNPDTDNDELPDGWEITYGLDPNDSTGVNGSDGDLDHDGWTNYEEWTNGTNPLDDASFPTLSRPEIIEAIPHHNAGISDNTRVSNDASFCVWIEDADGIDITDTESITFTINDGVNEAYTRSLSDATVIRVVKLTEDEDAQVRTHK